MQAATISTPTNSLCTEHRIVNTPIAGDLPALNGVEMEGMVCMFPRILALDAPEFAQLFERGLNIPAFIGGTGCEHGLASVPGPGGGKTGIRFSVYRPLNLRALPGLAAVGGYLHPADTAGARPCQAGNLIESFAGKRL